MPFTAFLLAVIMQGIEGKDSDKFPDTRALGLLLAGCMPGGAMSNVFTYYAKGDVALSMAMTLCSTLCGFVMVPLSLLVYSGKFTGGDDVSVDFKATALSFILVLGPALIGVRVRNWDVYFCSSGSSSSAGGDGASAPPKKKQRPLATKHNESTAAAVVVGATAAAHALAADGVDVNVGHNPQASGFAVEEGQHQEGADVEADHPGKIKIAQHKKIALLLEKVASIMGIVFIAIAMVYGSVSNGSGWKLSAGTYIACSVLLPIGALTGYSITSAIFWRMSQVDHYIDKQEIAPGAATTPEQDRETKRQHLLEKGHKIARTVAFETGVQNSSLALTMIAFSWDEGPVRDQIANVTLVYGFFLVVDACLIVLFARRKDVLAAMGAKFSS